MGGDTQRAASERAQKDQPAHPLRVARRVGDRDCAALRDAEQRELVELGGVDHRLQIGDQQVERRVSGLAVRQPAAARVVAMEAIARAQLVEPGAPDRGLPVLLDVGQPVRRPYERALGVEPLEHHYLPAIVGDPVDQ